MSPRRKPAPPAAREKNRARAKSSAQPRGSRLRAFIVGWLPVIGIVLAVRIALAEPYHIPSESMVPTLLKGDWLYVNKLRYGPHIPFTHARLPGYATPKAGDVVVFVSPPQVPEIRITPTEITPTLVKRIVGNPGDTLVMRGGQLFVNGTLDVHSPTSPAATGTRYDEPDTLFAWQHTIEARGSRFGTPVRAPSVHNWGPLVVPQGMYFMMGDNRDNSVDSRYYGPVPRENLRGSPMFIYYSYNPDEGLDYTRALTEIRWRRLGTIIR
ncbi:MAG TPA: signal peptidase I [Gemmatimonadaceae bacterium]|nr:signal peptidase I [Gemmatimonadaceae bacterium]